MPTLNWQNTNIEPQVTRATGPREWNYALQLTTQQLGELANELDHLSEADELRLELPRDWLIFWKLRDTESRFLLAHPEEERFVATIALLPEDARRLSGAYREAAARPGSPDSRAELLSGPLVTLGQVSNFELVISLL